MSKFLSYTFVAIIDSRRTVVPRGIKILLLTRNRESITKQPIDTFRDFGTNFASVFFHALDTLRNQ